MQNELLAEVERLGCNVMMRLNKLHVSGSVGQQRRLAEAKDRLAELLDLVQAERDRLDDAHGLTEQEERHAS